MISESSIIYGPDKEQESDPDLDPDPDLVVLFELDPEFVGPVTYEKPSSPLMQDDDEVTNLDRASIASGSSSTMAVGGRRVRIRNKIKAKMQGHTPPMSGKQPLAESRKPQLTALQRLEAMVVRYIKWLHILIQCRQLLCKKPITPLSKTVVETSSPAISVTESPTLSPLLGRRPSDLMMGASIGGGGASAGTGSGTGTGAGAVASAHRGLQKALATTATTTSAEPVTVSLLSASLASSPATSAANSDSTVSTSNSSVSSMNSSPSNMVPANVSATLSQPGSISASGDMGSRALLTATAALEAAAGSGTLSHHLGHLGHLGSASATLSSHLDPLSTSVTEAIRKSGARIKTMVDPLSGNHLFRVSSYHDPNKDSSSSSSSASSIVSLGRTFGSTTATSAVVHSGTGMQRTPSGASHVSNRSVGVDSGAVVERVDVEVLTGEEDGETSAGDGVFKSILDPTHPAHQSEDPILKVFETLGLVVK